jgi:hypothetical protein
VTDLWSSATPLWSVLFLAYTAAMTLRVEEVGDWSMGFGIAGGYYADDFDSFRRLILLNYV